VGKVVTNQAPELQPSSEQLNKLPLCCMSNKLVKDKAKSTNTNTHSSIQQFPT